MNNIIFYKSITSNKGLTRGQVVDFCQPASELFDDNLQLWLVDENWQALAEVSVMGQQLCDGKVSGSIRVDYIYDQQEQALISKMLVRMYACRFDPYIYFLIGEQEYNQAKLTGKLVRESLESEGFLHACPKNQLGRLATKHYSKVENLKVMVVDVAKLEGELKWEPATGGLYPHLFAPLNLDAVVDVVAFDEMDLSFRGIEKLS